ncbi:MAG: SDR family NAD(P)-dependent oxidoreductase [Gammaproteobacteria bacterium]|nr:SDR family NAD(P)-dependent oxidoreductase [Gammaproteobacteria bacterium]
MPSILITGANKGIGLAVVKAILIQQPEYRVWLGARDGERGADACKAALAETGADDKRLQVLPLDVSDSASVAQAAARVRDSGDELVGLVNNAGIAQGSLAQILDVNVRGMQRVCDAFIPLMKDGSRVVNVASASGPNYVAQGAPEWQAFFQSPDIDWPRLQKFMQECERMTPVEMQNRGLPANANYGLSKACANLLSLMVARANPQLLINACTPGYIETDMTRGMTGTSGASAAELGMKQPDAGAHVIMHLLFEPLQNSGWYYGSDAQRSPLDRYRAPGSAPYTD